MKRIVPFLTFALACLVGTAHDGLAQSLFLQPPPAAKDTPKKKLTPDNVPNVGFGRGFGGGGGVTWLDDEHYLQTKGGQQLKVEALTGKSEAYKNPGKGKQPRLAGAELATPSPDGQRIAFVRGGNLFVYDIDAQSECQLTRDGGGSISNGKADWVYYEELFNRNHKAFWWSPDSAHIAFLHFDDSKVPKYTLIDPTQRAQSPEIDTYPKAGATNPSVKLGIASAGSDTLSWVDLSALAPPGDPLLISRVGWLPDGKHAYFYLQDRVQTWLDVCTTGIEGGKPVKLLRDTTKAWVDDPGPLTFLKDGSFILFSARTGYKHLHHYYPDGKLRQEITNGPWEVRTLHRVDEAEGWIYFSGTRDGSLGSNLYRVKLDGDHLERLTKEPGTHTISLSPGSKYFIDTTSSYDLPPQVSLAKSDGSPIRVIEERSSSKLKDQYELGKDELVQVPMPDGLVLPARVILPPGVDMKKRYPVWFMTYAGPHAPTLRDSWSGGAARDHMLATMGFIVFRFDPRSASGMGAASAWTAYRQLGVQELKDIEAAITWLTKNYPVDAQRVGMSGHSYGGYMTAYALTHSKLFAAGIAGSPVTNWQNYDSIYTERYMGTPKDNPKGYELSSVVKAAKNLHGKLLIAHGMMDDNVHVQNTMELVDALQKADRDFEVMIYPHARHGLSGKHYQRLQIDFMKRALQP
jgi:dipeptidyl-peptidase 4